MQWQSEGEVPVHLQQQKWYFLDAPMQRSIRIWFTFSRIQKRNSLFWLLLVFFILIENSLRKFPNLSRERFVKSFFISCTFSTVTFLTIFFNLVLNVCISSWTICQVSFWSVPLIMLSTLRKILSKTDVVTNYVKRGKLFSHTSKLLEIYWFWC